jgi:hypothetical protein
MTTLREEDAEFALPAHEELVCAFAGSAVVAENSNIAGHNQISIDTIQSSW